MANGAVIDMWAPIVPTETILAGMKDQFPASLLPYLELFFKQPATPETWWKLAEAFGQPEDAVLADLRDAGVVRTLITGFDETTSAGTAFIPNELVVDIAARHPDVFLPFAGADVFRGMHAVAEFEALVRDHGFRGLSLRPFMIGLPPDHARYFPFYAKCVELDVPVSIHASHNWTRDRPSDLGHPRHLDAVACQFPDLKLIMSHAGYPWVLEACLIAWKHPHVYLELAAHRPRYFTGGSGWEPLLRFGQTTISDKILYGSGAFLLATPVAELIDEMQALPLAPGVLDRWMYQNAARLMGIEPA